LISTQLAAVIQFKQTLKELAPANLTARESRVCSSTRVEASLSTRIETVETPASLLDARRGISQHASRACRAASHMFLIFSTLLPVVLNQLSRPTPSKARAS